MTTHDDTWGEFQRKQACSNTREEGTIYHGATISQALTRTVKNQWNGMVEWNTGMDYWNDL